MMTDARRGAFNVLLVWSIDRFGRSMAGNVNDALTLDDAGVKIASVQQLAVFKRDRPRPQLRPIDRAFWIVVSRV
jgi:DNA invertase Pin-like site-specific DNA recombinase